MRTYIDDLDPMQHGLGRGSVEEVAAQSEVHKGEAWLRDGGPRHGIGALLAERVLQFTWSKTRNVFQVEDNFKQELKAGKGYIFKEDEAGGVGGRIDLVAHAGRVGLLGDKGEPNNGEEQDENGEEEEDEGHGTKAEAWYEKEWEKEGRKRMGSDIFLERLRMGWATMKTRHE